VACPPFLAVVGEAAEDNLRGLVEAVEDRRHAGAVEGCWDMAAAAHRRQASPCESGGDRLFGCRGSRGSLSCRLCQAPILACRSRSCQSGTCLDVMAAGAAAPVRNVCLYRDGPYCLLVVAVKVQVVVVVECRCPGSVV